jgi:hypothetical protein
MLAYQKLSDAFLKSGVIMPPEFLRNIIAISGLVLIERDGSSVVNSLTHLEQHQKLSMQGWVE